MSTFIASITISLVFSDVFQSVLLIAARYTDTVLSSKWAAMFVFKWPNKLPKVAKFESRWPNPVNPWQKIPFSYINKNETLGTKQFFDNKISIFNTVLRYVDIFIEVSFKITIFCKKIKTWPKSGQNIFRWQNESYYGQMAGIWPRGRQGWQTWAEEGAPSLFFLLSQSDSIKVNR